ncbi:hypothetical protein pipiens_006186 [Culex pipiens pipiens]|uniref:Uncharacterized protein n=1 Tax=Culex pipiens pipiens TaxID=38569 RepID=A0ABD1DRB9_CULPP
MDQLLRMTNRTLELRVNTSRLTSKIILANKVDYLKEIHKTREAQRSTISPNTPHRQNRCQMNELTN